MQELMFEEKKRQDDDEIQLFEIFLLIKKRAKIILGISLVAALIAAVVSFLLPPVYETHFILRLAEISSEETDMLLGGFNILLKENRFGELSKHFGITEAGARKLRSIKSSGNTKIGDMQLLSIKVEVYDISIIHDVKNGIVNYLNQNDYVRQRLSIKRESLIHLQKEIISKVNEIEMLKDNVTEQIKNGRLKDIGFNPIAMEPGVIELKQKLKGLESEIELLRGFEVAAEPVIPKEPKKPDKVANIAIAGATAFFLSVLGVFLKEWIDRNKKFYMEKTFQ